MIFNPTIAKGGIEWLLIHREDLRNINVSKDSQELKVKIHRLEDVMIHEPKL